MRLVLAISAALLLLTGCPSKDEQTEAEHNGATVEWYSGTMEQALAEAGKTNRPLFVYWGAVWCPPCNLLKATVFKDKIFIESAKKYISVYLDGDTESAQNWGEKLKASGYPTLMVLNSKGEEVVRLATTMPTKELAATLDSAFENFRPIHEVVAKVLSKQSVSEVTKDDWQYLANYAWTQDEHIKNKQQKLSDLLETLESKIPITYSKEKSRLYLNFLLAKFKESGKDKSLSTPLRERGIKRLSEIVESEELFRHNLELLAYYSVDFIKAIYPKETPLRDAVIERYRTSMAAVREKLPISYDRMITYYPLVELGELFSNKKIRTLSDLERDSIKDEMLKANKAAKDIYSKIVTTEASVYILYKAGMADIAKSILEDDLKKGINDYYTMSSIAWVEKELGNKEKYLEWSKKAYDASKGSATRIQWGSKYLQSLIEVQSGEKDRILSELNDYYVNQLRSSDSFLGRNKTSLDKLSKKVKEWAKKEKTSIQVTTLRKKMAEKCVEDKEKKTKYFIKDCENYFKKLI